LLLGFILIAFGIIGGIDDYKKLKYNSSKGMPAKLKFFLQFIFSAIAIAFISYLSVEGQSTTLVFPFFKNLVIDLGIFYFIFGICVITGTSNAVNLTDGLDGLASGSLVMSIGAFAVIGFWKFNQACDLTNLSANCYDTRDPLDLAVIAAAIVGALIGFLWFNTNPAQIFMGDSGSLGLGGALAALAILSRTEILLLLVGGLFAIEAGSVILQRSVFKITKWTTGKPRRIILMSPLHHHFEEKGWNEVTVVVRFWIICGLLVLAGIGLFYVEWIYGSVA
jgi:phospho-N-acetylmuramoyl-pentapeptide-transferase